jgi:hypothetical protein
MGKQSSLFVQKASKVVFTLTKYFFYDWKSSCSSGLDKHVRHEYSIFYLRHVTQSTSNRRHDIQHNDTQHNDTQHSDTQHNDTQLNEAQHNGLICDT